MSETKRRGQFTFYASYFDAVLDLPANKQWQTMKALIEYALEGRVSEELQGCARALFKAFKPNLDSARIKAEQARRRDRETGEAGFLASGSEPFSEPVAGPWAGSEASAEDGAKQPEESAAGAAAPSPAGQSKKENQNKDKNKINSEKERKAETEEKPERGAGEMGPGACGEAAAAGASPALSLSEREKKKILSQTPLIGRPPYAAMFRQDPTLIYYWRDLAQPGQGKPPMPEPEQKKLLSELLPLPPWARPAHLTGKLGIEN